MAQETIEYKGFWTIRTTQQYSQYIFIFGDNDIKRGKKDKLSFATSLTHLVFRLKNYPVYLMKHSTLMMSLIITNRKSMQP